MSLGLKKVFIEFFETEQKGEENEGELCTQTKQTNQAKLYTKDTRVISVHVYLH